MRNRNMGGTTYTFLDMQEINSCTRVLRDLNVKYEVDLDLLHITIYDINKPKKQSYSNQLKDELDGIKEKIDKLNTILYYETCNSLETDIEDMFKIEPMCRSIKSLKNQSLTEDRVREIITNEWYSQLSETVKSMISVAIKEELSKL